MTTALNTAATNRFLNKSKALARFSTDKVEALDENILKTDMLADRVVESFESLPATQRWPMLEKALREGIDTVENPTPELQALFEHVDHVPDWVDWEQLERGAIAYWRPGYFTGLALNCASLAAGYQSSSAVMPLIITGRLVDRAEKRKQETGRWALQASSPGKMARFESGFSYTVRVRLIHAFVRRKLTLMPEWDFQAWGAPINLTDTAYGISGEFSSVAIAALKKCGINYSKQERADIYALWRYVGYVLGVPENLMPASEADALEFMDIKELTDTRADDNSRALVKGLIENGGDETADLPFYLKPIITQDRLAQFLYGQVRYFAGPVVADELGIPDTRWKYVLRAFKPTISYFDKRRKRSKTDRQRAEAVVSLAWDILNKKNAPTDLASDKALTRDITKNRALVKNNSKKRAA